MSRPTPWCRAALPVSAGLAGLLVAGCASPPPPAAPPAPPASYVALLEDADGTTGKVVMTTPAGQTVLDKPFQAARFAGPAGQTFVLDKEKLQADFGAALAASPKAPVTFRLNFETGGAKLTAESEADLKNILEEIASRPVPDLSVVGHTDTQGDDAANERLGLGRARQVAGLIGRGSKLDAASISVESHGEKNLLVPTPDNTAEPRNRRVEVTIR